MTKYLLATSTAVLLGFSFSSVSLNAEGEATESKLSRAHNLVEMKKTHPSEMGKRMKAEKRVMGKVMSHNPEHAGKSDQALSIVKKHHPELHEHLMSHFDKMPVDEGFKLMHRPHFMSVIGELRNNGHEAAHHLLVKGLEGKANPEQKGHAEQALHNAASSMKAVVPFAIDETHKDVGQHGGASMDHHKMQKKVKKHQ